MPEGGPVDRALRSGGGFRALRAPKKRTRRLELGGRNLLGGSGPPPVRLGGKLLRRTVTWTLALLAVAVVGVIVARRLTTTKVPLGKPGEQHTGFDDPEEAL
jgi:hypothetical protein